MSVRLRAIASALSGFLRGFAGLGHGTACAGDVSTARDAESARHALEHRAARRKSCC